MCHHFDGTFERAADVRRNGHCQPCLNVGAKSSFLLFGGVLSAALEYTRPPQNYTKNTKTQTNIICQKNGLGFAGSVHFG
jgi:hypothetical protein